MKKILALLSKMIHWILYKRLNTKQKKYVANMLTEQQKEGIKRLFRKAAIPNKDGMYMGRIDRAKYKLRNLGFEAKAVEDLESVLEEVDSPYFKRLAAWELALWYANKQTVEGAEKSLTYIPLALDGEKDKEHLRQISIVTAECLDRMNHKGKALDALNRVLYKEQHPDLYLALSNIESKEENKLEKINKMFTSFGLRNVALEKSETKTAYDRLITVPDTVAFKEEKENPKVTVIMPVYHAEELIHTAIQSILSQTWKNLEVIVVDDCSSDNTFSVAQSYEQKDSRVKVIKTDVNGGAYIARNHALKLATGEFVTINDADDWSHAEKIEKQVKHLIAHPAKIGNTSQQARATEELDFFRRGKPGLYIFSNMSSFMFRREPVIEKIGYWDCVRFGGDSEFIKRIKLEFGEKKVVELATGPLCFQRQTETSLTGSSSFGFPGYFMGARKEYLEAQKYHHALANTLYYPFPQVERPFVAPLPMLPNREKGVVRQFDVIIMSDFRLDGGSTLSSIEEIKAHHKNGWKTGIVQLNTYDYPPKKKINPKVRELINEEKIELIVYGEEASCDLLILRYPPIFQERQLYFPTIHAEEVRLIVNQTPFNEYSAHGVKRFDLNVVDQRIQEYFGQKAIWHPIGPLVRKALLGHHAEHIQSISLSDMDWGNIIDLDDWDTGRSKKPTPSEPYTIGRHARDNYVKWPESKEVLLAAYPSDDRFKIKILGGAKTPKRVLGKLPSNWEVSKFDEISPKDFLKDVDFFVYYTHSDWIESFGRVIIEALAAGVPVIISPEYKALFKEAALYAEPEEVQTQINYLLENDNYERQVARAIAFIQDQFSYDMHIRRMKKVTEVK
ncbi:glycosyl transferase family A [Salipaludibacillus neizhouensis]|uniref:Glycosyl transferase family A n=1 Tax=Salipaludibacillus neizhouensis TaxID=885475 RepID=A0A3A9K937_9BACI|nr:glycosyltransferase [Salipaludibacillus neizhouensis]RKL68038.1 glycosyl transferase family A [Salipaludibacillus neizhouensis]